MNVRTTYQPLFEEFGVQMVFSGHSHNYERSVPINGVTYMVTGGGGNG
jgi:UDP-2,3-diacylglucosamine pyrophosphatase LpxH